VGARRYLLRKTLFAVVTLFFVLAFNFFLFRVMPGDPVAMLARSERLTPAEVAEQQALYGLDEPMLQQFGTYLRETLSGNLGVSLRTGQEVTSAIAGRIWPTLLLVGVGTLLATVLGIAAGIRGGWTRGSRFDTSTLYGSLVLYAMPEGWLGMLLLIMFAGSLGWFPTGGFETGGLTGMARVADILNHLFLPCLTLVLAYVGQYEIIMRSSLLEVMREEFVTTARAKGMTEDMVRRRHVVPNAFLPTLTLIALSFGFVLGGDIIIETVFSWPGLGLLTYQAINTLDYPLLQGIFLLSSASVIVANLVADVAYASLDPRVREG
jgi:peptide/nickel transport system permease protein